MLEAEGAVLRLRGTTARRKNPIILNTMRVSVFGRFIPRGCGVLGMTCVDETSERCASVVGGVMP